jgi:hypothetical protein
MHAGTPPSPFARFVSAAAIDTRKGLQMTELHPCLLALCTQRTRIHHCFCPPNNVPQCAFRSTDSRLLWRCIAWLSQRRSNSTGLCLNFFGEFEFDFAGISCRRDFLASIFRERCSKRKVPHRLVGIYEATSRSSCGRFGLVLQSQRIRNSHLNLGLQKASFCSSKKGCSRCIAFGWQHMREDRSSD